MAEENAQRENVIFALDIGTRSVIGVVGAAENGILRILQVETLEHSERAMLDGQIEDIEQTAKIAGIVKERLEEKLGFRLKEVHVAAAGRVLKTKRACHEQELDDKKPVDRRQVLMMEAQAVQNAYGELAAEAGEGEEISFCCVGHSVVRYLLDGYAFSTIENHRGKRAEVELIATFLPNEVVESIYTTMSRIGLGVASMTLEPIAAMNAVVPKELRLLNVALVDVGAGTSDIAIANGGSISGYTMATIAGDEITERVMREFLVDFQMAEQMKHMAGEGKQNVGYVDILGLEYTVPGQELLERILPSVGELSKTIAERILEVNGNPPMAVFMVGGGSHTPSLCRLVAQELSIDEKKVAIGGNNYMKRMVSADPRFLSAEFATPIGIAITAMTSQGQEDLSVLLNGERVRLIRGGSMTVMEALLRGGYQYRQIMGRSGKSITFELNGEKQVVRGEMPSLASIEINGNLTGITTPLQAGDEIRFRPAENGKDASPCLGDLVEVWNPFEVELCGVRMSAGTLAFVDGEPADAMRRIKPADKIKVFELNSLFDLLEYERMQPGNNRVLVNGRRCDDLDYRLRPSDSIAIISGNAPVSEPQAGGGGEKPPTEEKEDPDGRSADTASAGGTPASGKGTLRIVLNGEERLLPPKADGMPYQFFDVLIYVDIDPSKPQGNIVLRKNGVSASYLEPILPDDDIEVFWERV